MIRIEIDAENVIELKDQLKGLLNEPVKSTVTVTYTGKRYTYRTTGQRSQSTEGKESRACKRRIGESGSCK